MKNLILLHGALGSKKQFTELSVQLSSHYLVHILDFEGHGESNSNKAFSIELFTQNVVDYLDANQIKESLIFGYSMGGYVALNFASLHPERVSKILTYGTKFDWSITSAEREVKMLNPEKISAKIPVFAKSLDTIQQPNDWKLVMRKTADLMMKLGNEPILNSKLKEIQSEVIIGISDADKMVSLSESENVSNQLINGNLLILEGLPHPIDQIPNMVLVNFITTNLID